MKIIADKTTKVVWHVADEDAEVILNRWGIEVGGYSSSTLSNSSTKVFEGVEDVPEDWRPGRWKYTGTYWIKI
jgi:hypothetical protein